MHYGISTEKFQWWWIQRKNRYKVNQKVIFYEYVEAGPLR